MLIKFLKHTGAAQDGQPGDPDARLAIDYLQGEMVLKPAAERAYMFDHVWRLMQRKFYVQDLHGVDWAGYGDAYRRFLPHINNNHDFAELLSEMLGELNASHTGCYYRPRSEQADRTARLGLFVSGNGGDGCVAYDGARIRVEVRRAGDVKVVFGPAEGG